VVDGVILITGATGKTGADAAIRLAKSGARVRALVRNPDKAATLRAAGVEIAAGDVSDAAALRAALAGVDRAALILPNGERQLALETAFTDAAKAAGVRHLLKISSMEAVPGATNPVHRTHLASEMHIRASGLAWTMIRPNFYMQNFFGNAATIRTEGKLYLPMGQGRACMTDSRDVAEIVAHVLSTGGHEGQSYEITGPAVLSFADVAARFAAVLGRPVEYVDQDPAAYRAHLSKFLSSTWHVDAVCGIFEEIRHGYVAPPTDTFRRLTGHAPRDMDTFIRDHRAIFT
jgi:uncharacterized protein YbjT (DUF2867 family)